MFEYFMLLLALSVRKKYLPNDAEHKLLEATARALVLLKHQTDGQHQQWMSLRLNVTRIAKAFIRP